jgi:uncharacterized protein YkwD
MIRSKLAALSCSALAVLVLALAAAPPADAGWPGRHRRAACTASCTAAPAPVAYRAAPTPQAAQAASQAATQDPGSFVAWLNGIRARSGLGAVGLDPALSSWAAANNGQQQARGIGHHVMGAARRQNAGMGDFSTVIQKWMASPAHQAALLDPTITQVGIAGLGPYWTFNGR